MNFSYRGFSKDGGTFARCKRRRIRLSLLLTALGRVYQAFQSLHRGRSCPRLLQKPRHLQPSLGAYRIARYVRGCAAFRSYCGPYSITENYPCLMPLGQLVLITFPPFLLFCSGMRPLMNFVKILNKRYGTLPVIFPPEWINTAPY
jgi:hypothetical protein